ncbi:MAG: hypothetical protein AB1705_01795 [Verrucomicrobiota bacterium]
MSATPPAWSLVVPSCDAYNDTWPFFFHFLFQFWPDVPKPVYLIANHSRYADDRVVTIRVGEDRQWSANYNRALDDVPAELLFSFLDDFLINAPVDHQRVGESFRQFQELGAKYFSVDNFHEPATPRPGTWFCPVTREQLIVGLNATFWRKSYLKEVCEPGLNIWQAENRLKSFAKANPEGHYFLEEDQPPLVTYVESIKGFFWKPVAVEFLAKHGLTPNLWRRPCPPQGEDKLARFLRSLHKRRMRFGNRLNDWMNGELSPKVIYPLPTA